jgi:hypothetical protein
MKRYLLLALSLISVTTNAQTTLTAANSTPVAGTSITFYVGNAVPQGAGGANQTWNFSNYTYTSSSTANAQACPAAPGCGTFPGATLAFVSSSSNQYFKGSSTSLATAGYRGSSNGTTVDIVYSNPDEFLRFPFTNGNSYVDAFSASFTSGGIPFSRFGTDSITADGWGKLILPNATFNNTLRIKQVQTYKDSFSTAGTAFVYNYKAINYVWYSPNSSYPVFTITSLTSTAPGSAPTTTTTGGYTSQQPMAINDIVKDELFNITPNPARSLFNVRFPFAPAQSFTLTVRDIKGSVMLRQDGAAKNKEISISTSDWAPGLYLVQLSSELGTSTQKLIIQ